MQLHQVGSSAGCLSSQAAVVVARVSKGASGPLTDALEPLHESLAMAPAALKVRFDPVHPTLMPLQHVADVYSAWAGRGPRRGLWCVPERHGRSIKSLPTVSSQQTATLLSVDSQTP